MNYLHHKESPTNEEKMFNKAVAAHGYNEATRLTKAACRGDIKAEMELMKFYPIENVYTK